MHVVRVPDRILVVDHDPVVRQDIETHLTHCSYEVLTATNGEEALGILARQKIAGMITDSRSSTTPQGELLSQALTRDPTLAILSAAQLLLSKMPCTTCSTARWTTCRSR